MLKIKPIISYRPLVPENLRMLKKNAIRLFPRLSLKSYRRDFSTSTVGYLFRSAKLTSHHCQYHNIDKPSLYILKPILKNVRTLTFCHFSKDLRLSKIFYWNLTNLKCYKTTIQDKNQLKSLRYLKRLKSLHISTENLLQNDKETCMKLGKELQDISSLKDIQISLTKAHWAEVLRFLENFPLEANLSLSFDEMEGDPSLPSFNPSSVNRIKNLKLNKYPASLLEFLFRKAELFGGLQQLDLLSVNWGLALNKHKDMKIFSKFRSFENLKSLKVNFQLSYPNSESTEKFLEFFKIPELSLENLHLELNNFAPTEKDPRPVKFYSLLSQIQNCSKLTNLFLKFEFCQLQSRELNDLAAHLPHNLMDLKVLTLKIECFEIVLDIPGLINWLKSLRNLEYLELILPGIFGIGAPLDLFELPKLKKLDIQLTPSYSRTGATIEVLFDFLNNIKTITWLVLDFSAIKISNKAIEFLVKALGNIKTLKQLKISLSGEYGQLDTLLRFQTLFIECPTLKCLNLDTKFFVPWGQLHAKEEKFKEHFRAEKAKYGKALTIQELLNFFSQRIHFAFQQRAADIDLKMIGRAISLHEISFFQINFKTLENFFYRI